MILAFGALFDFPVVLLGLIRLGVVNVETLARARRVVVVLILLASAVLTPSPDPVSMLLLAVPLLVFFEATLAIARSLGRGDRRSLTQPPENS
jgi:sec-independent protein translocase protein TatC